MLPKPWIASEPPFLCSEARDSVSGRIERSAGNQLIGRLCTGRLADCVQDDISNKTSIQSSLCNQSSLSHHRCVLNHLFNHLYPIWSQATHIIAKRRENLVPTRTLYILYILSVYWLNLDQNMYQNMILYWAVFYGSPIFIGMRKIVMVPYILKLIYWN